LDIEKLSIQKKLKLEVGRIEAKLEIAPTQLKLQIVRDIERNEELLVWNLEVKE